MSRPDVRLPREADHPWHVAINRLEVPHEPHHTDGFDPKQDGKRFMYDAKHAADEVPRLALLFGMERRGELAQVHRQCSHAATEPVSDNHLTCCLGVECRACPFLAAIESVDVVEDQRDVMKAWTCVAHILSRGGDAAGEGYVLTVDDRMFWSNLYASLASVQP